jgi:hypothetical protein
MKTKGAIKIIKKRDEPAGSDPSTVETATTSRQAVRDMTQKVNSWVDEFQQRRDVESMRALRTLFPAS